MMKIAKWVGGGVVVVVVVLVGAAFLMPRYAEVSRSQEIAVPASSLFAVVGDLRRFNEWSPWYGRDTDAVYTFTGPTDGVGQTMRWQSDDPSVGAGSISIEQLEPDRQVDMALDFGDQGKATTSVVLADDGEKTMVTWAFVTDLGFNPISRYFGMWFDGMIGPDYEAGLANLKTLAEAPPTGGDASE